MIGEGDRIAVQAEGRATLRSGAPYCNVYAFVFRFAGDRVAEVTEYLDTAHLAQAFGVPPERDALLQVMDLNMWEMFREIIRVGRGGELLECDGVTMAAIRTALLPQQVMVGTLSTRAAADAVRATTSPPTAVLDLAAPARRPALEAARTARLHADRSMRRGDARHPGTRCEPRI